MNVWELRRVRLKTGIEILNNFLAHVTCYMHLHMKNHVIIFGHLIIIVGLL